MWTLGWIIIILWQSKDFLLYLVPIKQKFMSTWSGIAYTFMLNVWIVSFGQDIKLVLNIKWFLLFCFSMFLWNSFRKDLEKVAWFQLQNLHSDLLFFLTQQKINIQNLMPISTFDNLSKWHAPHLKSYYCTTEK